jgi:hypothetical protein|tara:strand:- start:39 stop:989 length:951 start_codon:yes stop_codon:yes gene_type:complete
MNNIVLISAFCNSEEKLNILRKNIKLIKSKGVDTAIISPLSLPQDIVESSDYIFITKENPIFDWPGRAILVWKTIFTPKGNLKLNTTTPDYGFAGLNHVKRLGEMFINYDYKHFTFIIYDTIITKDVLKVLEEGHEAIVYPSKRKNTDYIWDVGLHLLSFNKENLKKVIDLIDFEEYKKCRGDWDAFAYLHHKIVIPNNIKIGEFSVEDEIYYYEEYHDHSPTSDFKYFIHSPDENHPLPNGSYNLQIAFYNVRNHLNLSFNINNQIKETIIEEGTVVDLGIKKSQVQDISFIYKDQTYDLTDKISKLKHTIIEKL